MMARGGGPVQARAVATVQRAIDAAIELLDEQGDDRLRLSDVTKRSGVSNGSLMHHFGTRDGLVAAALATRLDRGIVARLRMLEDLPSGGDALGPWLATLLVGLGRSDRAAARQARFRALAFARHHPELRTALVGSFRTLERELGDRLGTGQQGGLVIDGLPSSALVVVSESYSVGRLLEGTLIDPLPEAEWEALFLAVLGAIVTPSVLEHARSSGLVARDAPPSPSPAPSSLLRRPDIPGLVLADQERAVVDHAVEHLRTQGEETLLVREVCVATGVSRGWFSRQLGGREELIDLARLDRLILLSRAEAAAYESILDAATSVEELRASFARVAHGAEGPAFLDGAWSRLDLLVAAAGRPRLAADAGRIVRAALARIADAVSGAQQRGLVRSDVSADAVARFLWGYPLASLLGELTEVPRDVLHALAERTCATLTPDATR